jgi:hypothetical protein
MEDVKIKLTALWVALMLTYQQGDVMRLYAGDFIVGDGINGFSVTPMMWLGINVLMAIPVVMGYLSVTLKYKANRWANIGLAIFFFGFNAIGLPMYESPYDVFLLIVSLGFNVLTVWHAWKWPKQEG